MKEKPPTFEESDSEYFMPTAATRRDIEKHKKYSPSGESFLKHPKCMALWNQVPGVLEEQGLVVNQGLVPDSQAKKYQTFGW